MVCCFSSLFVVFVFFFFFQAEDGIRDTSVTGVQTCALPISNKLALKAGYSYCEATEAFQISYEIPPAQLTPGVYRNVSGNQALAMGFVAAAQKSSLNLFLEIGRAHV